MTKKGKKQFTEDLVKEVRDKWEIDSGFSVAVWTRYVVDKTIKFTKKS